MIGIQRHINKLGLSMISLSMLLALSACSDSDTATEVPAVVDEPTETEVVDEAKTADVATTDSEPKTELEIAEAPSGAEEPAVETTAEPEALAANAGAKLYESNCQVCHAAGLLDAPKYGDTSAWTARLTKDKETLYMHSAKGFNKMPAQAVNGVTEAQVKAAVDYMLASVS